MRAVGQSVAGKPAAQTVVARTVVLVMRSVGHREAY